MVVDPVAASGLPELRSLISAPRTPADRAAVTDRKRWKQIVTLRISALTAFQVPVGLKKPVRHASHIRHSNDTLIIRCQLSDGSVGWGEGLPRVYVTGESIESVWRHLDATEFDQLKSSELLSTSRLIETLDQFSLAEVQPDNGVASRECFGNAVRCAIELALLDAFGRAHGISLGALVSDLPEFDSIIQPQQQVYYSGAVTSMSPGRQIVSAIKMRLFKFRMVKVKVGTSGIDDAACLRRVRRIVGSSVDLRVDANEAWRCDQVALRMQPLLELRPTCLEQPVPHADVSGLRDVRGDLGIPIMLDESLCCYDDGIRAIAGQYCDLFNIRLSKCGGILPSMRLAVLARQHGLGFQLGCQVGETGILSAAGRHFACNVKGIRYLEGSFDKFLVKDRLTVEDLTFKFGGLGTRLSGPGLGVHVDESRIRQLAVRTQSLIG